MNKPHESPAAAPLTEAADAIVFGDAAAFETWLDTNSHDVDGLWIKIAKQASGIASITSDEAVDIGLCFGWISGKRLALDDRYYLQRYVPRRPRSNWSDLNITKSKTSPHNIGCDQADLPRSTEPNVTDDGEPKRPLADESSFVTANVSMRLDLEWQCALDVSAAVAGVGRKEMDVKYFVLLAGYGEMPSWDELSAEEQEAG